MSLAVQIAWPLGCYDAATGDPRRAEWPPAPGRLVAALRSIAETPAGVEALRWLEQQDPPQILADQQPLGRREQRAWVPTNRTSRTGGSQSHPGRTNGLRQRSGVILDTPQVTFVWDTAPPEAVAAALEKLAAELPYLGRASSPVLAEVDSAWVGPTRPAWVPVGLRGAQVDLPVPYPGFVEALEAVHADGGQAWESYRAWGYRWSAAEDEQPREHLENDTVLAGPYPRLLSYALPAGLRVGAGLLGALTVALRRVVMARVPDPIPPQVSGHGADGLPHAAFLGLLDVAHRHADGHLLGLAVALPALGEPHDTTAATAAAAIDQLPVPGLGRLAISHDPTRSRPWGANPDRWVGPARRWATASPMLLDRHPRRSLTEETIVAEGVAASGLPVPRELSVSKGPVLRGAVHLNTRQLPRRQTGDRRPLRHVMIEFNEPVRGPVLVGALRHLGIGLFVPAPDTTGEGPW